MTSEQIAELRELLPPIARGDSVQIHRESYERAKELTLKLLDEREALLEALRAALSTHLHPFGAHTADACGMCTKFRDAIAKAESP